MLRAIKLTNVGPISNMEMELGNRLNLVTGDNGLGKSFLLDIAWWSLTRKWPAEVNSRLPTGLMARPHESGKASIEITLTVKSKSVTYVSNFDRKSQAWTGKPGRPLNPCWFCMHRLNGVLGIIYLIHIKKRGGNHVSP